MIFHEHDEGVYVVHLNREEAVATITSIQARLDESPDEDRFSLVLGQLSPEPDPVPIVTISDCPDGDCEDVVDIVATTPQPEEL